MMLNFDAKLINLCKKNISYPEKVWNTCVFSSKILYNATWKAHFSCTIIQLKPFFQPDCWNDNKVHPSTFCTLRSAQQNDRKCKFPFVSMLRHVKQMFSFWGFWNFCFQFVSFGCFDFRGVLIISTLQSISSFSRRR